MRRRALLCSVPIVFAVTLALGARQTPLPVEWPAYAGDAAATHYSTLAGITTANVTQLAVAWEWSPKEEPNQQFNTRPGNFQNTPLMIDNVLYVSTPYNRVVALDAESGKQLWAYDPKAYEDGQPPNGTGFVHRGVAAWKDGAALRIFMNSRYRLISLDAKTGEPVSTFGKGGVVDLSEGLRWPIDKTHYTNTSPPVVYKDLVIVGNGVGDRLVYKNDPPGDVRAFDARTGKLAWTFRTMPMSATDKFADTWGNESWKTTGHTNVWAPMSLDSERGLLYLPVSTPSNDYYGVNRPGANVFGESIVCVDAATGAYKWHFQITHHGLWDYDPPAAPILVSMTIEAKRVDAVVQLTKQGFAFVFDRVTGTPLWPIEEKPVPPSEIEGEKASPTQPFPTKPAALTPQGVTLEDAFDVTPALKAQAQAAMKLLNIGPMYTPPDTKGVLTRPGVIGGANWGGGAFDPENAMLYVKTSNQPALTRIRPVDKSETNPRAKEVDAEFVGDSGGNTTFFPATTTPGGVVETTGRLPALPLIKPPYGELVAISLVRGEIAWRVPFGDTPALRAHPLLKDVKLPERLGIAGAPGVIVTRGGLVFGGGGDTAIYAFDRSSGREVWKHDLPRRTSGTPMIYRARSGREFVVIATGSGANTSLVALALK